MKPFAVFVINHSLTHLTTIAYEYSVYVGMFANVDTINDSIDFGKRHCVLVARTSLNICSLFFASTYRYGFSLKLCVFFSCIYD